jgi:hypothetical protein
LKRAGPKLGSKVIEEEDHCAPTGGIYVKFDMEDFYKNLSGKLQVGLKSGRNNGGFTHRFRRPSLSPATLNRHKSAVFERNAIRLLA